jgi:hypothetical protein
VRSRGEVFEHGQELEDRVSAADGVLSPEVGSGRLASERSCGYSVSEVQIQV